MARRTPWPDLLLASDISVAAFPLFSQPLWSANPGTQGDASSERAVAVPGWGASW